MSILSHTVYLFIYFNKAIVIIFAYNILFYLLPFTFDPSNYFKKVQTYYVKTIKQIKYFVVNEICALISILNLINI